MVDINDFKEYDIYKEIKDSSVIMDRIKTGKTARHIYYWDSSSNNIMVEFDMSNGISQNIEQFTKTMQKLETAHDIFAKGYLDRSDTSVSPETYKLLLEYITHSAIRYFIINRKPFILLQVGYKRLNEFEVKCVFEYITHTSLYLHAAQYNDPVVFIKLGWWELKDIINKYKDMIKFGMSDYQYRGDVKW